MAEGAAAPEAPAKNPKATWALACGLIGVIGMAPFVPFVEYVFAPIAIVLGILGYRDASRGMPGKVASSSAVVLGVGTVVVIIARYPW